MNYFDYLPTLDAGEKARLFQREAEAGIMYQKLVKLSKYQLSLLENIKLGKEIERLKEYISKHSKCFNICIGVVGNYTMNHLKYHLIAAAFRRGILLNVEFSLYDSLVPLALGQINPFKNKLDFIFVYSSLVKRFEAMTSISELKDELEDLINNLYIRYNAKVILANCTQRVNENISISYLDDSQSYTKFKDEFNAMCRQLTKENDSVVLFDVEKLSSYIGIERFHHSIDYYRSKMPFSYEYADIFSDYLMRLVGAYIGIRKKIIALDLDGVLWGGILGDDKIGNIRIGNGNAEGEAFYDFQKYIYHSLYKSGIALTVVSKNNLSSVKEVFLDNSNMFLKEKYFAMMQVNWDDKVTNLKQIAKTLNVGLDSIVFVDDSKSERDIVRENLSEVTTIELGDNPADYIQLLVNSGYFDYYTLSNEDLNRAKSYKTRVQNIEIQKSFDNYNQYLKSLQMKLNILPFEKANLVRIVQLINKTNQFNLMVNRVTRQEIEEYMRRENIVTIQMQMEDKLENYGIISVLIGEVNLDTLTIFTWVMSCRVFNRSIEEAVINYLCECGPLYKYHNIRGLCKIETEGSYVNDIYIKRGFHYVNSENDTRIYERNIDQDKPCECAISQINTKLLEK